MITCKLCGTDLSGRKLRRDGSLLCPVCGQIYWRAAVKNAGHEDSDLRSRIEARYRRESMRSVERIRKIRLA